MPINFFIISVPLTFRAFASSPTVMFCLYKTIEVSLLVLLINLFLCLYISFFSILKSFLLSLLSFFFNFSLVILSFISLSKELESSISSTLSSITSSSSNVVSSSVEIKLIRLSNMMISSSVRKSSPLFTLIANSLHFFKISATDKFTSLA